MIMAHPGASDKGLFNRDIPGKSLKIIEALHSNLRRNTNP
jgi:hypothetical protein